MNYILTSAWTRFANIIARGNSSEFGKYGPQNEYDMWKGSATKLLIND